MPIYEYYCRKCDQKFEVLQKISEEPQKNCKVCEGPWEKLISPTAFHLKGTGWYATDFAGKSKTSQKQKPAEQTGCAKPNGSATSSGTCGASEKSEKKAAS
ncbi:MAG: zinc ribbon domain-containing protein [Deltaproteobacteria bacterium]|nr:zinc ribbon domain-containing protein [Deltaproteobacteria bacterium]